MGSLPLLVPGLSDIEVGSPGGRWATRIRHAGGAWIDLTQAGVGTVRLLGLLAALCRPPRPPLMGLAKPELNVHPGALAPLADRLLATARTAQVMVTTHSPDLVDALTTGRSADGLRIVERVDGATTVRKAGAAQAEAVRKHLFTAGELLRMGELEAPR